MPDFDTLQAALRGSVARLGHLGRPWCGATDAAATFVLTLLRLGWSAQSARHLTTHKGTAIDLLAVAPKTVGFWVDQASLLWSDSSAHWNHSKGPLFWEPSGLHSFLASWRGGHSGIGTCWSSWFREAFGRRRGSRGSGERTTTIASFATKAQAPCSTAATSARPCRQREKTHVSQEVRQAARSLGSQHWEQSLHMAFF